MRTGSWKKMGVDLGEAMGGKMRLNMVKIHYGALER